MKSLFRIYVGSGTKYFREQGSTMAGVLHFCLTRQGIEGYTMTQGKGVWRGEFEDALIVDVVDNVKRDAIEAAIHELLDITLERSVLLIEVGLSESSRFVTRNPYDCDPECKDLPPSMKF